MGRMFCRDRGPRATLRNENGFTLVEILVSMVISLIVIGGGVYGIARAFSVSNASTARVAATSGAEVGLQRLVLDVRDAINGSCAFNGASVSGVSIALAGTVTTLQMCDPAPGQSAPGTALPSEGVQWQCNTGTSGATPPPETCVRSTDTGTQAQPALSTSNRITGVQALELQGILNSATTPVYLPCDSSAACTANATATYTLNPGATGLSWIGIVASLGQNSSPGAGVVSTVAGTAPLAVRTGAALLNFGTS